VPHDYYVKRGRLFQAAVMGVAHRSFGASAACDEGIGQNPAMSPTNPSSGRNDREVLGSLPKTRPERRSAKRDRPARAARAATGAPAGSTAGAKRAATTKPAAAAGSKPAARPAAGAKRPKAPARKTAARAKIGADAKAPARPRKTAASGASKPVPPAGYAAPEAGRPGGPSDLMGTAVQAAGELAEIGATLAGQALRSALRRLPRP
jgi:hypothetical protein